MRNRKESHSGIRQNDQTVKKSQKHEANLQKNSTLYFQVGLIVCLLAAYGMFEMKFQTKAPKKVVLVVDDDPYVVDIPIVKEIKPEMPEPVKQKKVVQPKAFKQVENDVEVFNEIFKEDDKPIADKNPPIEDLNIEAEPDIDVIVDFVLIEEVPVYPGCERKKTNTQKKKCMSDKLSKLIRTKFNTSIGEELGLSGRQKVTTQFTIDENGNIIDIKTRASHPKLNKEAERVINKVPKMKPGKQRDKPVKVRYTLPIIFDVQN